MRLSAEKVINDLKSQNYVEVPLLVSREIIEKTANNFLNFLTFPQDIKDKFIHILDHNDRGSHAGYALKSRFKGDSDNKEYFNYRYVTQRVLRDAIKRHNKDARLANFLYSAGVLFDESLRALDSVVVPLNDQYPGFHKKIFADYDRLMALRFVKYDKLKFSQPLAQGHYDRGACTLAIAESSPGLCLEKNSGSLKKVVRSGHNAIFFPSYTFSEAIGSNEFPPVWHDVVQDAESHSKEIARWAIILFVDIKTDLNISYEDTHSPLKN